MKKLTNRQKEIFDYIVKMNLEKGKSPTIREIGRAFAIKSSKGVYDHLKTLERKGFIEREAIPRGIKINPEVSPELAFRKGLGIPVIGRVVAGSPVLAIENIEDYICVDKDIFARCGEIFGLKVKGDSMAEGILDGDIIIVRSQAIANNGDIVVAVIDDEATVKRFYDKGDYILLKADNPAYSDIKVNKDFKIAGKVIGLVRRY